MPPKDLNYRRFRRDMSQMKTEKHRACKAIIVDADYTLWNHEYSVHAAIQAVQRDIPDLQKWPEYELVAEYKEIAAKLRAHGGYRGTAEGCPKLHDELLMPLFARVGIHAPTPAMKTNFKSVYAKAYFQAGKARGGALIMLRRLRKHGYKIGAFHKGRIEDQVARIEKMGLWGAFDCILSGQEIHTAKPDVRVFEAMAHALGFKVSEVIVLGACLEADIHAGLRAGAAGAVFYRPLGYRIPEYVSEFRIEEQQWVPVINDLEQMLDLFNIPRTEPLAVKMTDADTQKRRPLPPRTPEPSSRFPRLEPTVCQQPPSDRTPALRTTAVQAQASGLGMSTARPLLSGINASASGQFSRSELIQAPLGSASASDHKSNSPSTTMSGDIGAGVEDEYQFVAGGTISRDSPSSPPRDSQSPQWELEMIDLVIRQPASRTAPSDRPDITEGARSRPSNADDSRPTFWGRLQRSVGLGPSANDSAQIDHNDDDDDIVMVE